MEIESREYTYFDSFSHDLSMYLMGFHPTFTEKLNIYTKNSCLVVSLKIKERAQKICGVNVYY